ncbi:ciliary microtubule inner protein 5 [Anarhichas minor]|uniref:ciliary microtubule inner protein 5 n=1 Tax=Anarhichas minor TaxID=65739 RepID=UPI003F7321AE
MDLNNVRRVSSAGYRLPERAYGTRPITTQQPADRTRHAGAASAEPNPDRRDPVKQDRVWREAVWGERRGVREWEKKWNFLRNYDQMGQLKTEEPLPSYVSLFSNRVPNTSNQLVGSRLSSPLGSELVRLDRLSLWSHHKRLQDPEMLPG